MLTSKEILFNEIAQCRKCSHKYGVEPFHFPMNKQRVMLITACPSLQAMYRPLPSVRFFRRVCSALFGDAGISMDAIEAMHMAIYWTHLHKCFYYEVWKHNKYTMNSLPDTCMKEYLKKEIDLLKPEIIIIMGKQVAQRILQNHYIEGFSEFEINSVNYPSIAYQTPEVYFYDFPETGNESHFNILRERLETIRGFEFMKRKDNKNFFLGNVSYDNIKQFKSLDVNIQFERKGLDCTLGKGEGRINGIIDVDDAWIEEVVLKNQINMDKLVKIQIFIEDEIRTFLMDVFSDNTKWFIIEKLKLEKTLPLNQINQNIIYQHLESNWLTCFKDYVRHLIKMHVIIYSLDSNKEMALNKLDQLILNIKALKKLRNSIVHNSGWIQPNNFDLSENIFPGVKKYVNYLCIKDFAIEEICSLADNISEIIKELNLKKY